MFFHLVRVHHVEPFENMWHRWRPGLSA
jgi:hypothetical protein